MVYQTLDYDGSAFPTQEEIDTLTGEVHRLEGKVKDAREEVNAASELIRTTRHMEPRRAYQKARFALSEAQDDLERTRLKLREREEMLAAERQSAEDADPESDVDPKSDDDYNYNASKRL